MIKFTILLVRKPTLTQEDFVAHHKDKHAKLFLSVPVVQQTVRRYIQQHRIPGAIPGMPPFLYDGITELWFDNLGELERCFTDNEYMSKIRPDEERFLNLAACQFVVSTENVVK